MLKRLRTSLKINIRFRLLMIRMLFNRSAQVTAMQYVELAELTTRAEHLTDINRSYFDWFNTMRHTILNSVRQGKAEWAEFRTCDIHYVHDWTHGIMSKIISSYPEKSD